MKNSSLRYQEYNEISVRRVMCFEANRSLMLPHCCLSSFSMLVVCIKAIFSSEKGFLFIRAISWMSLIASSVFPLTISHLNDSGAILEVTNEYSWSTDNNT